MTPLHFLVTVHVSNDSRHVATQLHDEILSNLESVANDYAFNIGNVIVSPIAHMQDDVETLYRAATDATPALEVAVATANYSNLLLGAMGITASSLADADDRETDLSRFY